VLAFGADDGKLKCTSTKLSSNFLQPVQSGKKKALYVLNADIPPAFALCIPDAFLAKWPEVHVGCELLKIGTD
jgi:hypothetical protein